MRQRTLLQLLLLCTRTIRLYIGTSNSAIYPLYIRTRVCSLTHCIRDLCFRTTHSNNNILVTRDRCTGVYYIISTCIRALIIIRLNVVAKLSGLRSKNKRTLYLKHWSKSDSCIIYNIHALYTIAPRWSNYPSLIHYDMED